MVIIYLEFVSILLRLLVLFVRALFLLTLCGFLGVAVLGNRTCRVDGRVRDSADFEVILVLSVKLLPVFNSLQAGFRNKQWPRQILTTHVEVFLRQTTQVMGTMVLETTGSKSPSRIYTGSGGD